ncbi:peptidoglycan editing factor PgeF [Desulfurivibrio dismutans]|uniref:peptidoglycan editing factor PgeF n=1 Tax=Desulfurivibrio dismutans TaxID=1398908 RepID=UPI0023DBEEC8|nr:peptidoglycan editing factor PgeF [Desulfurivibrio alkaliphilus]MDF1615718.1 peptidoglycan editing factor PgeF [Desulfurivibrio alkaliphilus]
MKIIRYRNFTDLSPAPVHGSFGRWGGVSSGALAELNVGFGVGDEPTRVAANRRRVREALGLSVLVAAKQVHGDRVAVVERVPDTDLELAACDALVCAHPGVGLLICQADCQAVMLYDPRQRVVANIHAGWRGSALNIIAATVKVMVDTFGCAPGQLRAAVSPSLGPCCAEFINYRRELPPGFQAYQVRENYFDFWAISRDQLQGAGLAPKNIEPAGICTRCDEDFFSYRRDRAGGRNGSVIAA